MARSEGGLCIEKLVGRQNYTNWKIAAQAYLELDNMWASTIDYETDANGQPKTPVDAEKDRKAKSKLTLIIDSVCYVQIQNAKTAKELWQRFADAYEDNGLTRRVGLLRKLITTSLSNYGSMDKFVNEIMSTAQSLNGIGFPIDEEWLGTLLLAGLSEDYRPMIMALENSGDHPNCQEFKYRLRSYILGYNEGVLSDSANVKVDDTPDLEGLNYSLTGTILKSIKISAPYIDVHQEEKKELKSIAQDGLENLAGFICHKLRGKVPDIRVDPERDSTFTWVHHLNEGGLSKPTEDLMVHMSALEKIFDSVN